MRKELDRNPEGFKYPAPSKMYDIDPALKSPMPMKSSFRTGIKMEKKMGEEN